MKFVASFVLTALFTYATFLFSQALPWWAFAVGAFVAGVSVSQKAFVAWLAGFAGVALVWLVLTYMANDANEGVLAKRMVQVFKMGTSPVVMVLMSALVGGLVGGFACMTGTALRRRV
jgi:hypothetical protein